MGNNDFNKQTLYTIYTLQFLPLALEKTIGNLVKDLDFIQIWILRFFLFFYHNKVIAFNCYSDFKCISC